MARLLMIFTFALPLLTGCFDDTTTKAQPSSEIAGTPATKPDTSVHFDSIQRPPKSDYKNPKF